ncbi:hypothetical protein C8Q80DRAFT_1176804 [Daedaleopsis nitida]|nr:hypothetical protein C8Q80DRAFT_1176804 [Daedaleopsis nitida]
MEYSSPTSSTFRCLAVSEILETIAFDIYRSTEGGRTLAGLARTCSWMHEFVIPVLWHRLDSLVPLLRLLPNDTWTEGCDLTGQGNFRLVLKQLAERAHDRLDWRRFDKYACHVRRFKWDTRTDVSIFTLLDIPSWRGGRILLPGLTHLVIQEDRSSYLSSLSFLISPTLTTVVLNTTTDSCSPDVFLRDVHNNCTMLTTLQISADRMVAFKGFVGHQLAMSLQGLPSLHTVCCQSVISAECFIALGNLPCLAMLVVNGITKEDAPLLRRAVQDGLSGLSTWFPALRELEWRMEEMDENTEAILQSFQTRQIDNLWLRCEEPPSASALQKSMSAIARSPYKEGLLNLVVEYMRDPSDTDMQYETSLQDPQETLEMVHLPSALESLALSSPQLVSLVFDGIHCAITDEAILWIATTFPLLRSIYLGNYNAAPQGEHNRLSFRALTTVAKNCSHLLNLELRVDDIHIDTPSEQDVNTSIPQYSRTSLEHLALCTRRLSWSMTEEEVDSEPSKNLDILADFIFRLFPKVRFEVRCSSLMVESHWHTT